MGNLIKRCSKESPAADKATDFKPRSVFGERLTRNVLAATFALACIVSAKDMLVAPDKTVLSVMQNAVESEWDETLGRLVYAGNSLSGALHVFSPVNNAPQLHQPSTADVADVFSDASPYIVYQPSETVCAAASCEVTSVTLSSSGTRYSVRTHCDNGLECLYFGLSSCFVSEGDVLPACAEIGSCHNNQLIFEVRKDGVSIDASDMFFTRQVQ